MPAAAILAPRRRPGHLVDAHDQRTRGGQRRHEQPEEDPTRSQARPDRAVEHAMLPLESGYIAQTDGTQRGTDHPSPWRQDGSDQQHLHVTPHGAREERRERRQECDNVWGEQQHGTTSWLKWFPAYSSLLHTSNWTKSS